MTEQSIIPTAPGYWTLAFRSDKAERRYTKSVYLDQSGQLVCTHRFFPWSSKEERRVEDFGGAWQWVGKPEQYSPFPADYAKTVAIASNEPREVSEEALGIVYARIHEAALGGHRSIKLEYLTASLDDADRCHDGIADHLRERGFRLEAEFYFHCNQISSDSTTYVKW